MFIKAKFLQNCFWHNLIVYNSLKGNTGKIRKIVNFTYTLKIYSNYKEFRTNFLKLTFLKLLSNSCCPKQLLTLKS